MIAFVLPLAYVLAAFITTFAWKGVVIAVLICSLLYFALYASMCGKKRMPVSTAPSKVGDAEDEVLPKMAQSAAEKIFGPSDFIRNAHRVDARPISPKKVSQEPFDWTEYLKKCPNKKEAKWFFHEFLTSFRPTRELVESLSRGTFCWISGIVYKGQSLRQLLYKNEEGLVREAANLYCLKMC